jgi:hypothetical protein
MVWALIVILTFDHAMPPIPSWYATQEDCRANAAAKAAHYELTGRPVSWIACQPVRVRS